MYPEIESKGHLKRQGFGDSLTKNSASQSGNEKIMQAPPLTSAPSSVRIDILTSHSDPRGMVFEPLAAAEIGLYRNVHVVITEPGAIRGNHRHVRGTEITSVVGPALVRFRDGATVRDIDVPADQVWRFAFPAGVAHAFKNTGTKAFILASFNTEEHNQQLPDAVRDVLIET
jgi:dTDP-4-dehydrorhamnose 3,5-epimerase-like enzyme